MQNDTIIMIPASMASSRLPGKPLLEVGGSPLLKWTYDKARCAKPRQVFVVSGDKEIHEYCEKNELHCIKTELDIPTGTHRCARALELLRIEDEFFFNSINNVINLQCDEPLVDSKDIELLYSRNNRKFVISTLVGIIDTGRVNNRNAVKATLTDHGGCFPESRCIWFSRDESSGSEHIGVYIFQKDALLRLCNVLSHTLLSVSKSLEQIAWLEYGYKIGATRTYKKAPLSINTQEDFDEFKRMVENGEVG